MSCGTAPQTVPCGGHVDMGHVLGQWCLQAVGTHGSHEHKEGQAGFTGGAHCGVQKS